MKDFILEGYGYGHRYGIRDTDMGSGIWDPGSRIRNMGSGIRDMVSGIQETGYGIWDMGSGIWNPGSSIRDMGSRIRDPGYGIREMKSKNLNKNLKIKILVHPNHELRTPWILSSIFMTDLTDSRLFSAHSIGQKSVCGAGNPGL